MDRTADAIYWAPLSAWDDGGSATLVVSVPDTSSSSLYKKQFSGAWGVAVCKGHLFWMEGQPKHLPPEALRARVQGGGAEQEQKAALAKVRGTRDSDVDDICEVDLKKGYGFPGVDASLVYRRYPSCFYLQGGKYCCSESEVGQ